MAIRVTVWNEFRHEKESDVVRSIYPDGIHQVIAEGIRGRLGDDCVVSTATLDEPEHGLTAEVLDNTDVLTWWGHMAHEDVSDVIVERVHQRVLEGMGLIVLHSGHFAKIFRKLMGTSCALRWRDDDSESVWTVRPGHPITKDIPEVFIVPRQEMYGEFFDVPQPDELIFISSFIGGEVFRSGCCWTRGQGRIFYFSPGHETYPVYHQPEIRKIIGNAVRWVSPTASTVYSTKACPNSELGWYRKPDA